MDPIIDVANSLLDQARYLENVAAMRAEVYGAGAIEFSQEDDEQRRWARRLRDTAARMVQERTVVERFGPELTAINLPSTPELVFGEGEELPF